MTIQAVTTKIISTLGNKESLIPMMLKDGVDSAALTVKSFKEGGPIEGCDRAIDEFGTQAIWIGGIPFFKKLIDSTLYKKKNINPGVDPRIIANEEYAQWAKNNAQGIMSNSKTQSVKEAITDCLADGGKTAKNLFKTKIIAATALTLGTFFLLTKLKQKNTKNNTIKSIQNNDIIDIYEEKSKNNVFEDINTQQESYNTSTKNKNEQKSVSFKGFWNNLSEAIMFNPVHNMKIIDAGITTERLACSRNKTELFEHAIKEGGFLFFLYKFGNIIESGINKLSANVLNKPIDLNIDVLMDNEFAKALSENKIYSDIMKAPLNSNSLTEKLDFIKNNPNNILVQAGKKSKIISTIKENGKNIIDTSKYIDMEELTNLSKNLLNIDEKFHNSNEPIKNFLNKTKALKVTSVMANIGISCLFLGYLIPKCVYKYRQYKTGKTSFHVADDIIKENKKNNSLKNNF